MADEPDVAALVAASLQDDDEAARALVRHLYPLVARLVRSRRPRRAAEEDLCQMIFIKIFQKLAQYSGAVPLEHWVSRIAINTCLNQIASENRRPELRRADLSDEQAAVVDNLAAGSEELGADQQLASRDLVTHMLAALKPAERLVIELQYLQEKSIEEIRAITGWSNPVVRVRAFRARQKLKALLSRLSEREAYGQARV
jgi:RNA polymerase sigma-70 factor (ECF subfamily)